MFKYVDIKKNFFKKKWELQWLKFYTDNSKHNNYIKIYQNGGALSHSVKNISHFIFYSQSLLFTATFSTI